MPKTKEFEDPCKGILKFRSEIPDYEKANHL
jgi:hypothetical protein